MHFYQNILCPVDFDENSLAAVIHAVQLAAEMDATLHLLHVITIIPTASEIVQSLAPQSDLSARPRLQKIADRELLGIKHQLHTKLAFSSQVPKSILTTVREVRRSYRNGDPRTSQGLICCLQRRGSGRA